MNATLKGALGALAVVAGVVITGCIGAPTAGTQGKPVRELGSQALGLADPPTTLPLAIAEARGWDVNCGESNEERHCHILELRFVNNASGRLQIDGDYEVFSAKGFRFTDYLYDGPDAVEPNGTANATLRFDLLPGEILVRLRHGSGLEAPVPRYAVGDWASQFELTATRVWRDEPGEDCYGFDAPGQRCVWVEVHFVNRHPTLDVLAFGQSLQANATLGGVHTAQAGDSTSIVAGSREKFAGGFLLPGGAELASVVYTSMAEPLPVRMASP